MTEKNINDKLKFNKDSEYDTVKEVQIVEIALKTFYIGAQESILDIQQLLGIKFETDNIYTFGGWFMNQFRGRLEKSAQISYYGYCFKVVAIARNSILRFEVKKEV